MKGNCEDTCNYESLKNKETMDLSAESINIKYQSELKYNKLLPYIDDLETESQALLAEIKANLGRAVLLHEKDPGCVLWAIRLCEYIKLYGMKFNKEDHILFIKLMYELVVTPELDTNSMTIFIKVLNVLLRKKGLILPEELQLPWEPLYDLIEQISKENNLRTNNTCVAFINSLTALANVIKIYFPLSATQEILDKLRPTLLPLDDAAMSTTLQKLERFLPVQLPPEYHSIGHELWFNEFMSLWEACPNAQLWENNMMWLMAKLAYYNIGYINWEPYIPLMFTRFIRCLKLPVSYNQTQTRNYGKMDTSVMVTWIVAVLGNGSTAQMYFEKFLKTIETYFHPANTGQWLERLRELLRKLPSIFVARLRKERYAKRTWGTPVPEEYKLTDSDVDAFVKSMMPVIMTAMLSKTDIYQAFRGLQYLAAMRPSLVIPAVLERVSSVFDSLTTEPLHTTVTYMGSIARPLAQGSRNINKGYTYPEGPTHILPLLFSLLPCIDPNITDNCFLAFRLITIYTDFIPIMDPSELSTIIDEEERMVYETTVSRYEDFVLQFLDRIFSFIDSSSLEFVRSESHGDGGKSTSEQLTEQLVKHVCLHVLSPTNDKIFECALHKLRTFITEHILETKIAGQLAAALCQVFALVNGKETLRSLVPVLSKTILDITGESNDIVKEENLDGRLLYAMLLLSSVVKTPGDNLLPHLNTLITVLDRVLVLKSREGNNLACALLKAILCSLSNMKPYKSESTEVMHWGHLPNINSVSVKWYIPGKEEIAELNRIFFKYLLPEINKLQKYCEDWNTLTKEELLTSLNIVNSIIQACESVLPVWKEEPFVTIKSSLKWVPFTPTLGMKEEILMPDGSNVKRYIVTLMNNVQKVILRNAEDDTKSLFVLIKIWNSLLLGQIRMSKLYKTKHQFYHIEKRMVKDKLLGNKALMGPFMLQRAELQHETRILSQFVNLTQTHKEIILELFTLATSRYANVRLQAQSSLVRVRQYFPFAYTIIVPQLIDILKKDPEEYHDAYKGVLYTLCSPQSHPTIMIPDLNMLRSLWPAIILSKTSEKLSVIRLKDTLMETVEKRFPRITITLKIPETCLTIAANLWTTYPQPSIPQPTKDEIEKGLQIMQETEELNLTSYNGLVNELFCALLEKNLHWRHRLMAMTFIRQLFHPDQMYSPKVVRYFLEALIHDSLKERKIAVSVIMYMLKQQKRKHTKITIDPPISPEKNDSQETESEKLVPGQRPDNVWLQYDYKTRPVTAEQWDEPRFVHQTYIGYYTWPKKIEIYAPSSEQPCLDPNVRNLTDHEKEVVRFFNYPQNVEKLVRFFSLEEKKSKDKLDPFKLFLFIGLFRNHGIIFLQHFLPHLRKLVTDKQESSQRCAAEIICGIIRGSKHWPFNMVCEMWDSLLPIIRLALANVTLETARDWAICFATAQRNRDPNRHYWLLECLMDELCLGESESSCIECGRLLSLQMVLSTHSWRVSELLHRLLKHVECRLLANPFQNTRERLGRVLQTVFRNLRFPKVLNNQATPQIEDLINKIVPRWQNLVNESATGVSKEEQSLSLQVANVKFNDSSKDTEINVEDREMAIRSLKTVCKWITYTMTRSQIGLQPEFYQVFPIICQLENCEADEELRKLCTSALSVLAQALTLSQDMPIALEAVSKMSKHTSWWTRSSCLQFLQVLVFYNMSIVLSNPIWVNCVNDIVLCLLEDERLEVRTRAGEVLSGLLHCTFIPEQETLLDEFKKRAKTKLYQEHSNQKKEVSGKNLKIDSLRIRHAAVLGMCAFIQAHPYDVPKYVPPIFEHLSPHMNDPQPIPTTIRKTLDNFRRTHHDGWQGMNDYTQHFTADQLAVLQDLIMPPSYYA